MHAVTERLTYEAWNMRYNRHHGADVDVESFLRLDRIRTNSQLRRAREALHLTLDSIAKRIGTSHSSVLRMEKSEQSGNITLNSIRKAAEAMDCEFIYVLRPKSRLTFSHTIWQMVYPIVAESKIAQGKTAGVFAERANQLIESPEFRQYMQWNKRAPVSSGGFERMFDNFKAEEIMKRFISRVCG